MQPLKAYLLMSNRARSQNSQFEFLVYFCRSALRSVLAQIKVKSNLLTEKWEQFSQKVLDTRLNSTQVVYGGNDTHNQ